MHFEQKHINRIKRTCSQHLRLEQLIVTQIGQTIRPRNNVRFNRMKLLQPKKITIQHGES